MNQDMNQDIRINLLPWRQARRDSQRRGFLWGLAAALALAALATAGMDWRYASLIQRQEARNGFLQGEIARLDAGIEETAALRQERQALLERMAFIQQLQGSRAQVAEALAELALRLAPGVHFTRLAMSDGRLQIEGYAETSAQLAQQLRQLAASARFAEPRVQAITAAPELGRRASRFDLALRQTLPAPASEASESGQGADG